MIPKETLDRIIGLAREGLDPLEIDGRTFSAAPLHEIVPPQASPLQVGSLSALAEYLKANKDGLKAEECAILVSSPSEVELVGKLAPHSLQRQMYALAQARGLPDRYESPGMGQEEFIVWLQTCFAPSGGRDGLLAMAGRITAEEIRQEDDDGITQTVTARGGISLLSNLKIPNPVQLRPYRTFSEIDQPESPFIFRVSKRGKGEAAYVSFSLHATGDQRWQAEACLSIGVWLTKAAPGWQVLA